MVSKGTNEPHRTCHRSDQDRVVNEREDQVRAVHRSHERYDADCERHESGPKQALRLLTGPSLLAAARATVEVLPLGILAALVERRAAQSIAALRCAAAVLRASGTRAEPFAGSSRQAKANDARDKYGFHHDELL